MRKFLSLLLSAAMLVTLLSAVTLNAFAADDTIEAAVTEMTVAGNKIFVYAPKSELIVSSTVTAPCFIVFGDEAYTAETAKAEAEASGLAKLVASEGATVVFINPQGETWAEADNGVYSALLNMYSNTSTDTFVDGIAKSIHPMTGAEETKILGGVESRIYMYAEGAGADFVAANYMETCLWTAWYGVTYDRTPTSVTLFNPTEIPAAESPAVIAVAVVNGPADTAEKLAGLTDKIVVGTSSVKDGFDAAWIAANYSKISGAYRSQAGQLLPMIDWAAQGIEAKVETFTVATSPDNASAAYKGTEEHPINVVTYYAKDLDVAKGNVPLVLCFHGGGNTALYEAQATEWPLIGKEHGFITVSVDLHDPNCTATEIVELIDKLKEEYSIDASRIYASGFSMGGVKSWDLFEQHPEVFAGLAPMDATAAPGTDSYNQSVANPNKDVLTPVFFVGGQASPLVELANQDNAEGPDKDKVKNRIAYAFGVNDVIQKYSYNANVNLWWGINGGIVYQVTDKVAFKDSTLNVNLFRSADGRYYTALADASNQSHEVYARNSWAAWDFLSQFSRNEDGSISINPVTYTLASDDGKITDNSYNTGVAVTFTDVFESNWFYSSVRYAVENGLMSGVGDNKFSPNVNLTRGSVWTILARMNDVDTTDSSPWYQKGLDWAVENEVSDGLRYGDGLSRQELATMLYRYTDQPDVENPFAILNDYPDASSVDDWAVDAMVWAVENGIITGKTQGSGTVLDPRGNTTRAEAVTILQRYCELGD